MRLEILYEDNHLLAVCKPAGLPTMGVAEGTPSLLAMAKDYIRRKYAKPGNVYLGVISRLDAPATGLVVLARTSKAAARMSQLLRQGQVTKTYWAVVERPPQPPSGECRDWLRKDDRRKRMEVCGAGAAGAQQARLQYRLLRHLRRGALLEVILLTGRKHQIRLQLAHRGWPLIGDRRYGARSLFDSGITLHALRWEFVHPVRQTPLALAAPLPAAWGRFGLRAE